MGARVGAYLALLDRPRVARPDEQEQVRLGMISFPNWWRTDLTHWLPLVKWLLAVPAPHRAHRPLVPRVLRRDRRLVRDPVHRPLPAGDVRLLVGVGRWTSGSRVCLLLVPIATRRSASPRRFRGRVRGGDGRSQAPKWV